MRPCSKQKEYLFLVLMCVHVYVCVFVCICVHVYACQETAMLRSPGWPWTLWILLPSLPDAAQVAKGATDLAA